MEEYFDLVIIGGGINGCGIAADAAIRGLKTLLIEQDDLASKTSSSSSKLIHGGLRYLEQYNFSLVKKALNERQILLQIAPHLVHPIPLMLPYKNLPWLISLKPLSMIKSLSKRCLGSLFMREILFERSEFSALIKKTPSTHLEDLQLRPAWLLRFGLFIYDHLSRKNKLPHTQFLRRNKHKELFSPLAKVYQKGFLFYDGMTDDARLTLSNALQATQYGAKIMTRTELIRGEAIEKHWQLHIKCAKTAKQSTIKASVVINTTGPWVETLNERLGIPSHHHVSLVKGSHILLPKLYEGTHGYLLQNKDQRVVFVLPYHGLSMIGTTEVKLKEPPKTLSISPEEINYLLKSVHAYFKLKIEPSAIVFSWSGVRPLIEDKVDKPQALSREYAIHYSQSPAPCVVVYGGKITTYRQLAQEAIDSLKPLFPNLPASRTQNIPLPGSNTPEGMSYEAYIQQLKAHYSWLDETIKTRLIANYGSRIEMILSPCNTQNDLGHHFGHGLYQCEVDYLIAHEWAKNAEDILSRRTKLGLLFNDEETQELNSYVGPMADKIFAKTCSTHDTSGRCLKTSRNYPRLCLGNSGL